MVRIMTPGSAEQDLSASDPPAPRIRRGHSRATDAAAAVAELHAAIAQPDTALVVFFCSSRYALDTLAAEVNARFAGMRVVGCTSAGEIGPAGYLRHSLCGLSFPATAFQAAVALLPQLQHFDIGGSRKLVHALLQDQERACAGEGWQRFAFLMIDGLSIREEPVTHVLQHELRDIPLFGGSAGDDMQLQRTRVFCDGAFHDDAAVLCLLGTRRALRLFKTQNFVRTSQRMVVTAADPARRIVHELNGRPAAAEYARLLGVGVEALDALRFAASPVVVLINGSDYVRSIQKANPDGSLSFFCAIEQGLVLRLATGVDMLPNLEQVLAELRAAIGPPELILVCDCVLRNLEATRLGIRERIGEVLAAHRALGFSTYGEQFGGIHINQTLTGIAIGGGDPG